MWIRRPTPLTTSAMIADRGSITMATSTSSAPEWIHSQDVLTRRGTPSAAVASSKKACAEITSEPPIAKQATQAAREATPGLSGSRRRIERVAKCRIPQTMLPASGRKGISHRPGRRSSSGIAPYPSISLTASASTVLRRR